MSGEPIFSISDVSISFGGLKAVEDFCLNLVSGDLHGLIGPNGAGKTTVFNLITGVYKPDTGRISLAGTSLSGLPSWRIAAAGAVRTFQNIRLFNELSVLDNVRVACHLRARGGMVRTLLRTPGHLARERQIDSEARGLLAQFGLTGRADDRACNLPYGDQRRLEIARALATRPKLLLLDEPAAGMNRAERAALAELIRSVRSAFNITILLIEHDMSLVMSLCEEITVLDYGRTIARGRPAQIQKDPKVIAAYLGEPVGDRAGIGEP